MSLTENAIDRRRCTLQCGFRYDTLRSQYFIVNYIQYGLYTCIRFKNVRRLSKQALIGGNIRNFFFFLVNSTHALVFN